MSISNENSKSLNKFISETGFCSRREADVLIDEGRVTINGQATKKGNRVVEGDEVHIDGKLLGDKPRTIYIAYNKPIGLVCTTDTSEPANIMDFINHPERLFPIGRIDRASSGLMLLTNDGDIVNKILRAGNNHEKEYLVTVRERIDSQFIRAMSDGVPILETKTRKCKVTRIDDYSFKIILTQGLNRQIRRMCEYLGHDVARLVRIRIMHLKLGTLPLGHWRELNQEELLQLHDLVANSSKTEEASRIDD